MNGQMEIQVRTPHERRNTADLCALGINKHKKSGKKTTSVLKKKSQTAKRATESTRPQKKKARQKAEFVETAAFAPTCDLEQAWPSTPTVDHDAANFTELAGNEPGSQMPPEAHLDNVSSASAEVFSDVCSWASVTSAVPEIERLQVAPDTAEVTSEAAPNSAEQLRNETRQRPWEPLLHMLMQSWTWIQRKVTSQRTKKRLRVCESVSLGEKRFIAVIQVDGEQFLVGGSSSSVSTLARLERPQEFADMYRVCEQDLSRA